MNKLTAACFGVILLAGTLVFAQKEEATAIKPVPDPRVDKILKQNEEILKTQAEILKQLEEVKTQLSALRRRTS